MNPPPIPPSLQAPSGPSAQPAPAVTSAAATASLVLSIVGLFCLPLIGGLAALLLGIVAIFDIRSSEGRKGGSGLAAIGIALGSFTTVAWGALLALALLMPSKSSSSSPPPPTVFLPPTFTAPFPSLTAPAPVHTTKMSRDLGTIETTIGKVTVVDLGASAPSLESELRTQRTKAVAANQTLLLQTTSTTCRPCLGVAASLADPQMQTALAGVRLVRVDVQEFADELGSMGVPHDVIPGFFLLGTLLQPSDGVHGGEWDDDTAANIAPVLGAFVRGKFNRRREPWSKRRTPRPQGTSL